MFAKKNAEIGNLASCGCFLVNLVFLVNRMGGEHMPLERSNLGSKLNALPPRLSLHWHQSS